MSPSAVSQPTGLSAPEVSRPVGPSEPSLLADAVARLHTVRRSPSHVGIHNHPDDDGALYVLGVRAVHWTIDAVRPLTDLIGWRAPASAWALVMVAPGRARHLDLMDGGEHGDRRLGQCNHSSRPGPGGASGAASTTALVSVGVARTGETAGRLSVDGVAGDAVPDGGRLLDVLRRNLGVPTAPPPEGTARFLVALWLAAVVAEATAAGTTLGWRVVVGLHPAARLLVARGERLSADELERIMQVAPTTWTWQVLRQAEIRSGSAMGACPPATAAWMDTGMYARRVLTDLPPPDELWRRVHPLVTPVARQRLAGWLQRSELSISAKCPLPDGG